ncbi:hypothetical protein L1987_76795 [Smallanthus sonchifolius]|uniref:Uncharacterized protein n=1 Tax=Smallanthus sonchifolius TaxID=185202 RepID=A0ACB8Z8M7_9ASTR|nr:hypothetical protein L1987_76795 [Smallanthus sonchifolius]
MSTNTRTVFSSEAGSRMVVTRKAHIMFTPTSTPLCKKVYNTKKVKKKKKITNKNRSTPSLSVLLQRRRCLFSQATGCCSSTSSCAGPTFLSKCIL